MFFLFVCFFRAAPLKEGWQLWVPLLPLLTSNPEWIDYWSRSKRVKYRVGVRGRNVKNFL